MAEKYIRFDSAMYAQALEIIAARGLREKYEFIGIRTQEVPFALGPCAHRSNRWDDGTDTGEPLRGLCATKIQYYASDSRALVEYGYLTPHIAIVCGNDAMGGEDPGEIVIEDPVVEYIFG